MFSSKNFVTILIVCLVHGSLCKPYSHNVSEGRGIGSTLWGWISYPFSWWSSNDTDIPAENGRPIEGVNSIGSYDTIEIGKHNVTIWCSDQMCTTMKCDKYGCVNTTCNIYDTDLNGECRKYNTVIQPEELTTPKSPKNNSTLFPKNPQTKSTTKTPIIMSSTIIIPSPEIDTMQSVEERPLELEAVLSSTVTEKVDQAMGAE